MTILKNKQALYKVGIPLLYDVVGDNIKNRVIQIGQNLSRDSWALGDIRWTLVDFVNNEQLPVSSGDIDAFLRDLVSGQLSARSIRDLGSIAQFYSDKGVGLKIRDEFSMLSHNHFRTAMRYGDNWRMFLDIAKDKWYRGNSDRVPSVEWVEMIMGNKVYDTLSKQFDNDIMPQIMSGIVDNEEIPLPYSHDTDRRPNPPPDLFSGLRRALQYTLENLLNLPISKEKRERLDAILNDLLTELGDIQCPN